VFSILLSSEESFRFKDPSQSEHFRRICRLRCTAVMAEENVRYILKRVGFPPERLGDLFLKIFGHDVDDDLELPPREPHEPIDLHESQVRQP
jgi:hypothetical protein